MQMSELRQTGRQLVSPPSRWRRKGLLPLALLLPLQGLLPTWHLCPLGCLPPLAEFRDHLCFRHCISPGYGLPGLAHLLPMTHVLLSTDANATAEVSRNTEATERQQIQQGETKRRNSGDQCGHGSK
ncbi:hypothetical protein CALCODRAFT_58867 [Calocera cornea HHB12733]|uniref:Uncharacterized protein n=1 Tax=Calocera cornea HHB12733 TaxID=1353952 RepID=A0A165IW14_9BASI|nr:hypothetical protein CALCODRAFT_58867 [Calocera cornea HHB12733]